MKRRNEQGKRGLKIWDFGFGYFLEEERDFRRLGLPYGLSLLKNPRSVQAHLAKAYSAQPNQKEHRLLKLIIKIHVVTAILGWLFFVIGAGVVVKDEGGLAAFLSLCITEIATVITIVDLLSVFYTKKQKTTILPIISAMFWGTVLLFYGISMFYPNTEWQGRVFLGVLTLTAIFKIYVSISMRQEKLISN